MRIGTFRCLLFGHIFVGRFYDSRRNKDIRAINNCRRCGIPIELATTKQPNEKRKK